MDNVLVVVNVAPDSTICPINIGVKYVIVHSGKATFDVYVEKWITINQFNNYMIQHEPL